MGFHFCPSLVLLDATLYRCHVMINDCFFLPARMSYTYDQDVTILAIGFWVDGRQDWAWEPWDYYSGRRY